MGSILGYVYLYVGSPIWDFKNVPKLYLVVEMTKIEFVLQLWKKAYT